MVNMFLLFFLVLKTAQAQVCNGFVSSQNSASQHHRQNLQSSPSAVNHQSYWASQPKCWPSEAKAYFLPSAPASMKAAAFNTIENSLGDPFANALTKTLNEKPRNLAENFANKMPLKFEITPPPPCLPILPGIINEFPTIFLSANELCPNCKRQVTAEEVFQEKPTVLPNMFNFDKELVRGFLNSLGL
ncbi:uncharacterized protein LOC114251145 [Bombyx mandarina]|uniref:Uncharacterized protein LOC114251145 n=1 Tax=Bombyx mandarina TaxID=7092 RepID=A0A6J2KFL9_BOMMA|nr:uncharacterized protein LOC114251145 [Bombyx mandarina]